MAFEAERSLLPGESSGPGRTAADNRLFPDAVLWIAGTAAPGPGLPARFGKPTSVLQCFNRRARHGVRERVLDALPDADTEWLMPDPMTDRRVSLRPVLENGDAPATAARRPRTPSRRADDEAPCRDRRPRYSVALDLDAGQRNDITQTAALLDGIAPARSSPTEATTQTGS